MQPILAPVAVPLLLFVPGFLTLRGLFAGVVERPTTETSTGGAEAAVPGGKPLDLIEGIGLSVSASFLVSSVAAFTLVLLGIFSLWLLLVVVGIYSALIALATRLRRPRLPLFQRRLPNKRDVWVAFGVIVMVGLALALYSRYSENILLIRDPATHANTAVHIAKSGGSVIEDPLYYSLEESLQTTLVYERPVDSLEYRSGGFQVEYRLKGFLRDARLRHTTPQFFNLFPTWQAIGYSLFGLPGVLLVSSLFGAFSVLLIFLVGRRLFGSVAGIAAAMMLSVNLAHFWHSRTSGSEVMFQFTFLTAVLFLVLYTDTRQRLFGVFAGLGFGALTLIRIDSIIVLVAVGAFFLYLAAARRIQRRDLFFLLPLIAVATLGLVDTLYSSRPYAWLLYRTSTGATAALAAIIAAGAAAALIAAFPRLGVRSFLHRLGIDYASRMRLALAFGLIGLAVFAYFVRPMVQESFSQSPAGVTFPRYAEESFVRLGWYLSPLGLVLASIGGAIALYRSTSRGMTLFLLTGLLFTLLLPLRPQDRPRPLLGHPEIRAGHNTYGPAIYRSGHTATRLAACGGLVVFRRD